VAGPTPEGGRIIIWAIDQVAGRVRAENPPDARERLAILAKMRTGILAKLALARLRAHASDN
jgi:hypothetical protein